MKVHVKPPVRLMKSKAAAVTTLANTMSSLKTISEHVVSMTPNPTDLLQVDKLPSFHDIDNGTFSSRRKLFLIYLCASVAMAVGAASVSVVLDLTILPYKRLLRGQVESAFIVIFAHSLFILLITALGFFSYIRHGYKTLVSYSIFSVTLFMLVVMCVVYSMAMRHEFHEHLHPTMLRGLRNYGEVSEAKADVHWDNLQKKFQCCGVYAASDWHQNAFLNWTLPDSCCQSPYKGCGKERLLHPETVPVHFQGCYQTFHDWLGVYTYGMIGFALFMALWQMLGVYFSWNLARITRLISKEQRLQSRQHCCV